MIQIAFSISNCTIFWLSLKTYKLLIEKQNKFFLFRVEIFACFIL